MIKMKTWESALTQLRRHEVEMSHLLYDSKLSLRLITPHRPLAVEARIRFSSVFGFRVLNLEDPEATDYLESASEQILSVVDYSEWLKSVSETLEVRESKRMHFVICLNRNVIEVLAGEAPSIELE